MTVNMSVVRMEQLRGSGEVPGKVRAGAAGRNAAAPLGCGATGRVHQAAAPR
jgi:hypothetical protein